MKYWKREIIFENDCDYILDQETGLFVCALTGRDIRNIRPKKGAIVFVKNSKDNLNGLWRSSMDWNDKEYDWENFWEKV